MSFKKPTELLRQANAAIQSKTGFAPLGAERPRHTDTMEILSPSLVIAFKERPGEKYPSDGMKGAALAGAKSAQSAVAHAANVLFKVIALRHDEPALLTQVLEKHFGLSDAKTDLGGGLLTKNQKDKSFSLSDLGKRDRRWVIEKIRARFLHLSFHLNTGIYLIDIDPRKRTVEANGQTWVPAENKGTEAYVRVEEITNSRSCGYRNGEIHVGLRTLRNYSPLSYGRVIIHEAVHKYLEVDDLDFPTGVGQDRDVAYAHDATYHTLTLAQRLVNADCYAWAATSLYAGRLLMGSTNSYNPDWAKA